MAHDLALVLHAHQPAGNFDHVIEHNYQTSYFPFLAAAERRPWLRLNLHFTGYLLDWLARRHPEYIALLRGLLAQDRIEFLGGGYYEPILATIPPPDQQAQIRLLSDRLEAHFGLRPRGAWLAERVWEPELPQVLAAAGMEFTLLDDAHFQSAGIADADLHGFWLTESDGATVGVAPSNYFLRQAIPFRPEAEALDYLRRGSGLVTMGDDLEKFGSWPHTHQHVHRDGWLERFLDGLADAAPTVLLSPYRAVHPPRGLIYLPTASYPEMMEWARNASWRGFFTRYRESNLLHKTMWDLSARLPPGERSALQAAQCNDVYWHGWFGGLYSPHLRNLAFENLLAADALAPGPPLRRFDLHRDGGEIIELRSPALRLLLNPLDGATLEEIDALPARANLMNSIRRRPERYHDDLLQRLEHNPAHLPQPAAAQGTDLESLLLYDPFPRTSGRLHLCPSDKRFADFQALRLDSEPAAAAGRYEVTEARPGQVTLRLGPLAKTVSLDQDRFTIAIHRAPDGLRPVLEMTFNLLAPDAEDRYFEQAGQRFPLRWAGELPPAPVHLADGWRGLVITLEAPGAEAWWICPIYTVSQSETGFEAIYQGSAVAAVWPTDCTSLQLAAKIIPEKFPLTMPLS